jgi:hypothetical protein
MPFCFRDEVLYVCQTILNLKQILSVFKISNRKFHNSSCISGICKRKRRRNFANCVKVLKEYQNIKFSGKEPQVLLPKWFLQCQSSPIANLRSQNVCPLINCQRVCVKTNEKPNEKNIDNDGSKPCLSKITLVWLVRGLWFSMNSKVKVNYRGQYCESCLLQYNLTCDLFTDTDTPRVYD